MFDTESSNANMLKYKPAEGEHLDPLTLQMLRAHPGKGLLPVGRDGEYLLYPIAGMHPAEEALRNGMSLKELVTGVLETVRAARDNMIPVGELVLHPSYLYIKEGQVCMLCIPTDLAPAYSVSHRDLFRCLAAESVTVPGQEAAALSLLKVLNREDYDLDRLIRWTKEPDPEPAEAHPERDPWQEEWARKMGPIRNAFEEPPAYTEEKRIPNRERPKTAERKKENAVPFRERVKSYLRGTTEIPAEDTQELPDLRDYGEPDDTYFLVVRATGREVPLGEGETVIGSDPQQADVCLSCNVLCDPVHARIFRDGGSYFAEDLRSKAGIKCNGRKVRLWHPERLNAGDVLRIGEDEIVFSRRRVPK